VTRAMLPNQLADRRLRSALLLRGGSRARDRARIIGAFGQDIRIHASRVR